MDIKQIGNERIAVVYVDENIEIWFDKALFSVPKNDFHKVITLFQEAERVFGITPFQPKMKMADFLQPFNYIHGGHNGD
jgi:hypothetical protein